MVEHGAEGESGELRPDLEDVLRRVLRNYQEGGLAAVETMVDDLAAEAAAADTLADSGERVGREVSAVEPEEFARTVELVSDLEGGHVTAASRHSFALRLLEALKEAR